MLSTKIAIVIVRRSLMPLSRRSLALASLATAVPIRAAAQATPDASPVPTLDKYLEDIRVQSTLAHPRLRLASNCDFVIKVVARAWYWWSGAQRRVGMNGSTPAPEA